MDVWLDVSLFAWLSACIHACVCMCVYIYIIIIIIITIYICVCMYEGIDMGQQRGKKRCMCLHVSIPAVAPVFLSRGEWG